MKKHSEPHKEHNDRANPLPAHSPIQSPMHHSTSSPFFAFPRLSSPFVAHTKPYLKCRCFLCEHFAFVAAYLSCLDHALLFHCNLPQVGHKELRPGDMDPRKNDRAGSCSNDLARMIHDKGYRIYEKHTMLADRGACGRRDEGSRPER